MAFEPGGYADKLGNRFEGRWVVRQVLRLLNEELVDVTVEAVGDDEAGVDLWLTYHDGHRQAQQCKARNGSHESWSVADLNSRGILAAMKSQLDREPSHEFALVSAIPATVIGDICESARQSTGDPESFFEHQIESIGEHRRKAFRQFCDYLKLDYSQPNGRAAAYDYLRRTHFILHPDNQSSHADLRSWAGMLAIGTPTAVVAALADYTQENLRRKITANDVQQHLSALGFHCRRLAHDGRVGPAVEELKTQFSHSIAPGLIAGKLIKRDETVKILDDLKATGVVVLHGTAGSGKSGVLYELTQHLSQQGHAFIPIRLDRQKQANTTRQFGENLGLPESPSWCLESLAGTATSVLILDQLDALRWTSAHSASALDVCKSLVREVLSLRKSGKDIKIVLACRTFDLEHDPEIKSWLKESPAMKCQRVEVKPLPEDAVKIVVESLGQDFAVMLPKQKRILQSPHHLGMWAEIVTTGDAVGFQTSVQLIRQFWKNRSLLLADVGITASQADEVINQLADYMERKGHIWAPGSLVADRPQVVAQLHSHGILQTSKGRISFCHQSYLDFRIATRLLKEVHQGTGSVRAWLGDKSQQSLFRREQLRQVLPASRSGTHYFNCGIPSHFDQLAPIIRDMLSSESDEIAQQGAKEVTGRWLFHGLFEDELEACREGSVPQRKGVAQITSHFVLKPEYSDRCESLLLPLCDDDDAKVRRETRIAFHNEQIFNLPNARRMVTGYIKSKAFTDDPSPLMWSLEEFSGSLIPFTNLILLICEIFADSLRDASKDISTGIAGDAHMIPPILLRLYEQTQDQGDAQNLNLCLDAWDLLFEKRVGATRDLTHAIEQ